MNDLTLCLKFPVKDSLLVSLSLSLMLTTQRAELLCFSTKAKYVNKAADSNTLGPSPNRSWCLSNVWLHIYCI